MEDTDVETCHYKGRISFPCFHGYKYKDENKGRNGSFFRLKYFLVKFIGIDTSELLRFLHESGLESKEDSLCFDTRRRYWQLFPTT